MYVHTYIAYAARDPFFFFRPSQSMRVINVGSVILSVARSSQSIITRAIVIIRVSASEFCTDAAKEP